MQRGPFHFAFRLPDGETERTLGSLLHRLTLTMAPATSSLQAECTDSSRCCTQGSSGGVGFTVDAITVPESCGACPPGTSQIGVDKVYHLLQCDCDGC